MSNRRSILLNEAEQRHVGKIGGNAHFDERLGLVLLWRVELREARAQNVSLPEILGTKGFLLGAIIDDPDFRALVLRVADQDQREERLVGLQVDLTVQLRNERT